MPYHLTVDSRVGGTISADIDDDLSFCLELMCYTLKFVTEIFWRQVMQTAVGDNHRMAKDFLIFE